MSNNRTFSFDSHDDHDLNPVGGQASHEYQYQPQPQPAQESQDSHTRDMVSPPPRYASPSPQYLPDPVSPPISPRRRPVPQNTHLLSDLSPARSLPRLQIPTNNDDLPPPLPPPHRASLSRPSREDSTLPQSHQSYPDGTSGMYQRGGQVPGRGIPPVAYERHNSQDYNSSRHPEPSRLPARSSYGSAMGLAAGAATPGNTTPIASLGPRSSAFSGRSIPLDDDYPGTSHRSSHPYPDSLHSLQQNPYDPSGSSADFIHQASINPSNILDDGDDGFMNEQQHAGPQKARAKGGPAGLATGTAGTLGGLFGRKAKNYTSSGSYDPVGQSSKAEKSEWLSRQSQGKRKMRWWVGVAIGLVVVIAIVAGIVGGVLGTRNSAGSSDASSSNDNNANTDTATNGDLSKNSAEIQALMNNKDLHKVFPGIDYTPWGTQYPLCFTYPPSQNNVTRDMAVLSQLTNTVRLYGTDCNQTQMVLHAIDRLELTDMKVWMGVWIDTNTTTNDRQLAQMYSILEDTDDISVFKGVIVGNEALYRAGEDKAQSEQELITILTDVKSKFKTKGYDLPVATSDLGDNWNAELVQVVDYVMSNIHPFFAGVTAEVGASWTWDFWQTHDVVLTEGVSGVGQVISETGWPSGGGTDCGGSTGECATGQSGSVAGVDGMNTFMDNWVCQALANGTEYFWFEAFDEPWKIIYNTATQQWEDKWGLMDPGRNLKPGLQIPDCDGKTVAS